MTQPGWMYHPLEPVPDRLRLPKRVLDNLPAWRAKWLELWTVDVAGRIFVFRSPTRTEALVHDANFVASPAATADRFVSDCLLEPEKLPDDLPLEQFDLLYRAIWVASGFRDEAIFVERLKVFDSLVASPAHEYILILLRAFPGLRPDEINSWQPDKITYHLAVAKALLVVPPTKERRPRGPTPTLPQSSQPKPEQPASPAQPQAAKKTFDWEKDLAEWRAFDSSPPSGDFNLKRLRG